MATYKSKPVTVPASASAVSDKFADLRTLESALGNLPDDERAKIGQVDFTADSLSIHTPQAGELKFKVTERTSERVVFKTVSSPLPLDMVLNLRPLSDDSTELITAIEVEIPAMLKPLLGGMMQKAADSFGALMAKINGK